MSMPALEVAPDLPVQTALFEGAPVTELRAKLTSVMRLPIPESSRFSYDQAVRGSFVGNIKGFNQLREQGGTYVGTYLVEVVEVTLDGE